jgi:lipoprotein NlpI
LKPDDELFAICSLMRGQLLAVKNHDRDALACFDSVLRRIPHHNEAMYLRGCALGRLGRVNDAIDVFNVLLSTKERSNDPDVYNSLGGMLAMASRFDEAVKAFDRVLELVPNHEMATANRQFALQRKAGIIAAQPSLDNQAPTSASTPTGSSSSKV